MSAGYRVAWGALATPGLMRRLARAAGVRGAARLQSLRPQVARVLARVGGLPVATDRPGLARRAALAAELLHEAVRRVLRAVRPGEAADGYVLVRSKIPTLGAVVAAVERVPVNRAGAARLAAELRVSPAVAKGIAAERAARGPFTSLDDLDVRAKGIGPETREAIAHAVRFDRPADLTGDEPWITGDFDRDFARLVSLQDGATRLDRLEAALAMLATETAREAHPAVRRSAVRPPAPTAPPPALDAAWLGALFGSDYHAALLVLLAAARTSVDVCMFHIAVPHPGHPTFRLLDALRTAHARGVAVRVLMDQDRESDPYRSTIINSPAKALLEEAGIACRLDHTDRLLHSKFVLIDGTLVILGSHNWTAGSYFQFDDLSVAVSSPPLAEELGARFATLWELSAR